MDVLCFDSSKHTMLKRMEGRGKTSGRVDDNVGTTEQRIQGFRQESQQIIRYCEEQGKFHKLFLSHPTQR